MEEMYVRNRPSPCLTCSRVPDPRECDHKACRPWQQWFLARWELIHNYPRAKMEAAELKPVGVKIGGRPYAAPHQVRRYVQNDPCQSCLCPKDLCLTPCPVKKAWEQTRKDVFL